MLLACISRQTRANSCSYFVRCSAASCAQVSFADPTRWCARDVVNHRQLQRRSRAEERDGTRGAHLTTMRVPAARRPWLWSWPWPSDHAVSRVTSQRCFAHCNAASSLGVWRRIGNVGSTRLLVNAGTPCLGSVHPWLHSRRSAAATTVPPIHPPPSDPERDAGGDKNKQKLAHLVVPRTVRSFVTFAHLHALP